MMMWTYVILMFVVNLRLCCFREKNVLKLKILRHFLFVIWLKLCSEFDLQHLLVGDFFWEDDQSTAFPDSELEAWDGSWSVSLLVCILRMWPFKFSILLKFWPQYLHLNFSLLGSMPEIWQCVCSFMWWSSSSASEKIFLQGSHLWRTLGSPFSRKFASKWRTELLKSSLFFCPIFTTVLNRWKNSIQTFRQSGKTWCATFLKNVSWSLMSLVSDLQQTCVFRNVLVNV